MYPAMSSTDSPLITRLPQNGGVGGSTSSTSGERSGSVDGSTGVSSLGPTPARARTVDVDGTMPQSGSSGSLPSRTARS